MENSRLMQFLSLFLGDFLFKLLATSAQSEKV